MNIIMHSNLYLIKNILKKTNAKGFDKLKVGDVIYFESPLAGGGTTKYHVDFKAINYNTKELISAKSGIQMSYILDNFEMEELINE